MLSINWKSNECEGMKGMHYKRLKQTNKQMSFSTRPLWIKSHALLCFSLSSCFLSLAPPLPVPSCTCLALAPIERFTHGELWAWGIVCLLLDMTTSTPHCSSMWFAPQHLVVSKYILSLSLNIKLLRIILLIFDKLISYNTYKTMSLMI